MRIAFTICSANYLPFAKVLGDSIVRHNPSFTFIIALADSFKEYDTALFSPHQVIPVANMRINSLEEMKNKYTIFELSCALKPFIASSLLQSFRECTSLYYFDADIFVYNPLTEAEAALQNHSILLTPHVTMAVAYELSIHTELDILRVGLYNAGFFALKNDSTCFSFLAWWQQRVKDHCYNKALEGLFVDQVWLNLVPLYFRSASILFHPGYNLAYWNFPERSLDVVKGVYQVNGQYPLVFFHFSGYDINRPDVISRHRPAYTLSVLPQYESLFKNYQERVMQHELSHFFSLPATWGALDPGKKQQRGLRAFFQKWFRQSNGST